VGDFCEAIFFGLICLQFYTCGGSHIAAGIRGTFIRTIAEHMNGDEAQATEMFKKIQSERYATDVFG
jgi:sulfite reductase alpha subunit-like flavoprotein